MEKKIDLENMLILALGSVDRLNWYLKYNIDLINYLKETDPKFLAFLDITSVFIPKKKKQEMLVNINVQKILQVLERRRPDLYKIINTQKGLIWIERNIENFKKRFL